MMSKCYLDTCLSYILEKFSKEYTAGSCTKNDSELIRLRELRDLLFAISNTVEYFKELTEDMAVIAISNKKFLDKANGNKIKNGAFKSRICKIEKRGSCLC